MRKGVIWIAMAGMILVGLYQWFYAMSLSPISETPQQTIITIEPGSSVKVIAQQLEQQGLMDYPSVFNVLLRITKQAKKLRAGDYRIDTTWNYQELLKHLTEDPEVQYPLTIIEGMTLQDAVQVVRALPKIKQDLSAQPWDEIQQLLGLSAYPEGMLLPNTYFITAGTKESVFYRRAYQALTDVMEREWPARAPNLPFQMDPTVIYGMGAEFQGNIRKKDLQTPTPYNTYTNKGLPPTPIALASAESIYAVLHPAQSDVLYFVAKGDGSHVFSSTLEAHNAAVRQYQLGIKP
ncbi:MAG: hypothetical protein B7X85_07385 [Thiotrichales bacterium 17-46-47]|nr:MAG: hypothetical protein B7X85_07385 [Thiotrichales bacterium 17-46-47]